VTSLVVGWLSRACTVAKRCIHSYYGTLIGNPTPGIQWYNFRAPGVTPNWGMGPPWGTFCQITLTSCLSMGAKVLGTFTAEQRKFHRCKSSTWSESSWTFRSTGANVPGNESSTGTKVPSVDLSLPGTKVQRNKKSRYPNCSAGSSDQYWNVNKSDNADTTVDGCRCLMSSDH